jgi:hypothetical protein
MSTWYYTTRVLVALGTQHAMRMPHIICGLPSLRCFSTLSHKRHDLLSTKCDFLIFSTIFVCNNISHSKKKWVRYDKKCILVFILSILYSFPIVIKREFSGQIFEKSSDIQCHENPTSGTRVVPCGRTDGQTDRNDEADSRFSQFCERA